MLRSVLLLALGLAQAPPLTAQRDLLVVSGGTNEILQYDGVTGVLVGTFAAGLNAPTVVIAGPDGNVYVANSGDDSVRKLDGQTGADLGVFVTPSSGGLNDPRGLAFRASNGNLLVSSQLTQEILEYDGDSGAFVGDFVGPGSGLIAPGGLTTRSGDPDLYIAGTFESTIYRATPSGDLSLFGLPGGGGLLWPIEHVFGPNGNLFITSSLANEVQERDGVTGAYDPGGSFVSFGSGGLSTPRGLAFGDDGHLYVVSGGTHSVKRYDGTTGDYMDDFASTGLVDPFGMVFQPDPPPQEGDLLVVEQGTGSIRRYHPATGNLVGDFSTGLNQPTVLTVGPDLNVYVAIAGDDSVVKLDGQTGANLGTFVSPGSGGLDDPRGLLFRDSDGNLLVASQATQEILEYDGSTGAFVQEVVSTGAGLAGPAGLASNAGLVIVADTLSSVMFQVLPPPLQVFGAPGGGGLTFPTDVTFGPNGNAFIASNLTDEVKEWDGGTGAHLQNFVTFGDGGLSLPHALEFGDDGHLWVVSQGTGSIKRYDGVSGMYLGELVSGLSTPTDLAFVPEVPDNFPPIAVAGPDQTVLENRNVVLDGSASSDPELQPLLFQWTQTEGPPVVLDELVPDMPTFVAPLVGPGGDELAFELVVNDGALPSAPDEVRVQVKNWFGPGGSAQTQQRKLPNAPDCTGAYVETPYGLPGILWPPTDEMVEVRIVGVVDEDAVSIEVLSVTQDEPLTGTADALIPCDAGEQADGVLYLRAARDLSGTYLRGRVYHVTFRATDTTGLSCTRTVEVCVPLSESHTHFPDPCLDDGPLFDSLAGLDPCSSAPPSCAGALASVQEGDYPGTEFIWPPTGEFVEVEIQGITDDFGPGNLNIEILGVTQDETLTGNVDAIVPCEQVTEETGMVLLRAERDVTGTYQRGRVYHVSYRATDASGMSCQGIVEVCVPLLEPDIFLPDPCLDDGPLFDSIGIAPPNPCLGPVIEGAVVRTDHCLSTACNDYGFLWPADDALHEVQIVGLVDPAGGVPAIDIQTITQDEPLTLAFDAELTCEQVTAQAGEVFLRASRDLSGTYLRGRVYHITYLATDSANNTATSTVEVCVPQAQSDLVLPAPCLDDGPLFDSFGSSPADPCGGTPPDCSGAFASVQEGDHVGTEFVWPPTGEFVEVKIDGIVDDGGPGNLDIEILGVTVDESLMGAFDSMIPCEQVEQQNGTLLVRATRDIVGTFLRGRVYHIAFRATDVGGQSCSSTVEVCVPLTEGHIGLQDPCLDDGPLFDALGTPPSDPCNGPIVEGALLRTDHCVAACNGYGLLWPADDALHEVQIVGLVDPAGGQPAIDILTITQDEPLTLAFDAELTCDQVTAQAGKVFLRASRDTSGTYLRGRVYHVTYLATDAASNTATSTIEVCVPESPGDISLPDPCLDDGPLFDAFGPSPPDPCGG